MHHRSSGVSSTSSRSSSVKKTTRSRPRPGSYYRVRAGDSWRSIAKTAYGDGNKWRNVADANPGKRCVPKTRVYIPRSASSDALSSSTKGGGNNFTGAGAPRYSSGTTTPQSNSELAADLRRFWTAANIGVPGSTRPLDRGEVPGDNLKGVATDRRMQPNSLDSRDTRPTWYDEESHGPGGGHYKGTLAHGSIAEGRMDAWRVQGEAHTQVAGTDVMARGSVSAGTLKGRAKWVMGVDNGNVTAEVSGRASARAVSVEGELATGVYGNNVISGKTSLRGEAFVGAEIGGKASVGIGKDGARAAVGVDAFAGAKARARLSQDVGLAGEHIGRAAVRGEVYAGIGVKANAHASFGRDEDGRLKFKFGGELGAALGIGAGLKTEINIDITGVVNVAKKVGDNVGGAVKTATDAVHGGVHMAKGLVEDGAAAVGNAVSSGFKAVKSMFW